MKKLIAVFLLSVMVCTLLCACQKDINEPAVDDVKPSAEAADKNEPTEIDPPEETEPAAPEPEPEPEQDDPPTPVDIETIGGVVIVGRIGFDESGWHIVPEQTLNISYSYFLDKPSVFPLQTRVSMMDPKDDGVEKAVYLGQTVTVQGEFRFVRNDFEKLYLLPYTITVGKTVEGSYGNSELKAPEGPVDLYDHSEPLPKYLEPLVMDGCYVYNAFMLSEESLQLMGNGFALFYCDFVDAILSYRNEITCPEERYAEMLGSVIYYDFPIFNACAEPYEFFKHYDRETGTIHIKYIYSEDEHNKLIEQFLNAADDMLASVRPDMSEVEKAKIIYHNLCTRVVYDDSALEVFERKDSYYAYLHHSGVCVTFANVYNQLLTQTGIKTTLAACNYDATMGHVWSVVTLDGRDYFCDPTFELSYDKGKGYIYFGMDYADRTKDGVGADGIRIGRYYTTAVLPEMIAEHSLEK